MKRITDSITDCEYHNIHKILPSDIDKVYVVKQIEKIIEKRIADYKPIDAKPNLINVSGIPGSGKTYYCEKVLLKQKQFRDFIYIAFDDIMEDVDLPYHSEKLEKGTEYAFARWELPARIVGYELLRRAVEKRISVVFEHSSSISEHILLFQFLKEIESYRVGFHYLDISIEEAIERTKKRQRFVPEDYFKARKWKLDLILPVYKNICAPFKEIHHQH